MHNDDKNSNFQGHYSLWGYTPPRGDEGSSAPLREGHSAASREANINKRGNKCTGVEHIHKENSDLSTRRLSCITATKIKRPQSKGKIHDE